MKVWYAAYGSNLSRARFDIYLRGGRPDGATHTYPGCRDASDPTADVPASIDAELCFGGWSQTWGGGVAFVRPGSSQALARLYLVGLGQFEDVVAQENWLAPGSVRIDPRDEQIVLDGDHTYRVVIPLGLRDGVPVVTVSQPADAGTAEPTPAYLRYIAEGLRESHAMAPEQIARYLAAAPGAPSAQVVAGAVS